MKIYKVNNFQLSSSVFAYESISNKYRLKTNPDMVVFIDDLKQEISLNSGNNRVAFQVDGTIFFGEKQEVGDGIYTTYPVKLDSPAAFVIHDNSFNQTDILKDLYGISIKEDNDDPVEVDINITSSKVELGFSVPEQFTLTITKDGVDIDGNAQSDNFSFKQGSVTVKGELSNSDMFATATKDRTIADLNDSDENEYYYEYDVNNKIFIKKKLEIEDDVHISNFGSVLNIIKGTQLGVSMEEIYNIKDDTYYNTNSFKIIWIEDGVIKEFNTSRILSVLTEVDDNGVTLFDHGFFKTSDYMFPGYVYVGSSYAYITYYRSKAKRDECTYSEETGLETAFKVKVKKDSGIEVKTDNTTKTVLTHSDADFATDLFKVLQKGVGVFYNHLFKLKKYKDEGDKITITYNYKNSDNNYVMTIEDQTTRFVIEDTRKVDGDESTETKRYYRYHTEPMVDLSNTKSQVNIFKKKWIDDIADPTDIGIIYAGKLQLTSYQVVEKDSMIILNPYNTDVTFDREKVSIDTLARIAMIQDNELKIIHLIYQPTTGSIYTKIDGNVVEAKDYVSLFNDNSDYFKAKITCDYAKLTFKTLANEDRVLEFPISTYFIAEPLNGTNGMFYRVYYKNIQDVGYIDAIKYTIKD